MLWKLLRWFGLLIAGSSKSGSKAAAPATAAPRRPHPANPQSLGCCSASRQSLKYQAVALTAPTAITIRAWVVLFGILLTSTVGLV